MLFFFLREDLVNLDRVLLGSGIIEAYKIISHGLNGRPCGDLQGLALSDTIPGHGTRQDYSDTDVLLLGTGMPFTCVLWHLIAIARTSPYVWRS